MTNNNRTVIRGPYTARQVLERPKLLKRLRQLTNGGFGRKASTLYPVLSNLGPRSKDRFWLVWHKGEVVAWAWVEGTRRRTFYTLEHGLKTRKVSTIGTFVHHKYRRRGIGKRLVSRLDRDVHKSILFIEEAWNTAGNRLYETISHRTEWSYTPGVRRY